MEVKGQCILGRKSEFPGSRFQNDSVIPTLPLESHAVMQPTGSPWESSGSSHDRRKERGRERRKTGWLAPGSLKLTNGVLWDSCSSRIALCALAPIGHNPAKLIKLTSSTLQMRLLESCSSAGKVSRT